MLLFTEFNRFVRSGFGRKLRQERRGRDQSRACRSSRCVLGDGKEIDTGGGLGFGEVSDFGGGGGFGVHIDERELVTNGYYWLLTVTNGDDGLPRKSIKLQSPSTREASSFQAAKVDRMCDPPALKAMEDRLHNA